MSVQNNLAWEEVEDAATQMFNLWGGGPELAWAREAWAHLASAGLTQADSAMDRTRAQLRLVMLAYMYNRFCHYAWEEAWSFETWHFAEHVELNDLALGVLYGELADHDDFEDPDEQRMYIIDELANSMQNEVYVALCKGYGGAEALYARLWLTRTVEPDEDDDGGAFDYDANNQRSFEFVMQGFIE